MVASTSITSFAKDINTIMTSDNKTLSEDEFILLLNATTPEDCLVEDDDRSPQAAAVAAVYFVPGLGEVALLTTGGILIGGAIYYAGSWIYDTFNNWLQASAKQEAEDAADSVSNKVKVKGSNDKVEPRSI